MNGGGGGMKVKKTGMGLGNGLLCLFFFLCCEGGGAEGVGTMHYIKIYRYKIKNKNCNFVICNLNSYTLVTSV